MKDLLSDVAGTCLDVSIRIEDVECGIVVLDEGLGFDSGGRLAGWICCGVPAGLSLCGREALDSLAIAEAIEVPEKGVAEDWRHDVPASLHRTETQFVRPKAEPVVGREPVVGVADVSAFQVTGFGGIVHDEVHILDAIRVRCAVGSGERIVVPVLGGISDAVPARELAEAPEGLGPVPGEEALERVREPARAHA